ncbi:MAG: ribonuclease D [Candidatus Pacebacteria bacterium]|nr:ribonuclease D [Candidatus Paceibacterota bacterium]
MQIELHHGDLPSSLTLGKVVAIDSETMGLQIGRDRLCLVQLCDGSDSVHLVKFAAPPPSATAHGNARILAPNLAKLLTSPDHLKLFHFGRFDIAVMAKHLGVVATPVYCTKIASRLARTFTDKHGLKHLCKDLLNIELSKEQQASDWGRDSLTDEQMNYAAQDVIYLHRLQAILDEMLIRENRRELATASFDFLPHRAVLDNAGWPEDIFAH